ncbi:MAG: hypothetical protein HY822_24700 [Acidobacteria bacterium]|nr:hypothetical protein [Acidobacteriota bacterium]
MRSFALPSFWDCYRALPPQVRDLAGKQFRLFRENPAHPSLGFARKGEVWTAEIGRNYRALARRHGEDVHWFWIGTHEAYNRLLTRWK